MSPSPCSERRFIHRDLKPENMITALMLTTKDRWWCQHLAVEQWINQKDREPTDELMIVSEDRISVEVIPELPQVRLINCTETTLPDKWNVGVAFASNEWITFWGDDDWHGLRRLALLREHATSAHDIVGAQEIYVHELIEPRRSFLYAYGGQEQFVVDGTMMFRRTLWEQHPFTACATKGAASWWMVDRIREGARVAVTPRSEYVYFIHGQNLSARRPRVSRHGEVLSDSYMTLLEPDTIERIVPDEYLTQFYAACWAQSGEQA